MQFDALVAALRAVAEPTRLRLLRLCAQGELSVNELTQIMGQSQPRVSRHLKLMVEAEILVRFREGAQVFYRSAGSPLVRSVLDHLAALGNSDDLVLGRDLEQLQSIRHQRLRKAQHYFDEHAAQWDALAGLEVPAEAMQQFLQQALRRAAERQAIDNTRSQRLLDLGTGTGQVLEWLADGVAEGVGVDINTNMLGIARSRISALDATHLSVRSGDVCRLPFDDASFDVAVMHMVLHYIEEPVQVLSEARRVLPMNGVLLVVDFAPHAMESLRQDHQHRWLGFSDQQLQRFCQHSGLRILHSDVLAGSVLTVKLWMCSTAMGSGSW